MSIEKSQIVELFKILHDTYIEDFEKKNTSLIFKIAADFLLDYIYPGQSHLFLEFKDISKFEFVDWSESMTKYNDFKLLPNIVREIWITNGGLNENGMIEIHGHGGNSPDNTSCGGSIVIGCNDLIILNENKSEILIDQLRKAADLFNKNH